MKLKERVVNVAVQVLPLANDKDMYQMVDAAIEIIQKSGLKHVVSPFETVIEGPYEKVMLLVNEVQEACYQAGADKLICNLKIQSHKCDGVLIEDKMEKYS
ncbi:MAG: thiamine-binding protein [Carboxylicivirga sp.]|jgi:uncharacterized protein (TIGR00106 family)|nr:thiamine-binding protein [Carboxylicivirga sp.]